jgi:formate-nitrite transporter family protein
MGVAPSPDQIYERATVEGRRRLSLSTLDQVSTGFIAGVTIIFGVVALGVVEGLVAPRFGAGAGSVAGALAFAIGVVFLVVGRSELFTEDFFDPVAAAIEEHGRRPWARLLRLWSTTLVLNLVGGALLVALLTVDGALPEGAAHTLSSVAEATASKTWAATLVRAVLAGALLTLLCYMLHAVDTVASRSGTGLHTYADSRWRSA